MILGIATVAEANVPVIMGLRPVNAAEKQGMLDDVGGNQRLNLKAWHLGIKNL